MGGRGQNFPKYKSSDNAKMLDFGAYGKNMSENERIRLAAYLNKQVLSYGKEMTLREYLENNRDMIAEEMVEPTTYFEKYAIAADDEMTADRNAWRIVSHVEGLYANPRERVANEVFDKRIKDFKKRYASELKAVERWLKTPEPPIGGTLEIKKARNARNSILPEKYRSTYYRIGPEYDYPKAVYDYYKWLKRNK